MQVLWVVSLYVHEQRAPRVWDQLCAAADHWDGGGHFDAGQPFMRTAVLPSLARAEDAVAQLRAIDGSVVHLDRSQRLGADDYARADLVAVFAAPQEQDVVLDADRVLTPTGPCPACGLQDSFDVAQSGPLTVDVAALVGDAANLPGGGLAVSGRVVDVLVRLGARGWRAEELRDPGTGGPAAGWAQLVSDMVVLLPCPRHTRVLGAGFCPACGRAHGIVEGYTWVPRSLVDRRDVVARHPGGRAMLHLSRRAVDALSQGGVSGLIPADVLMACSD